MICREFLSRLLLGLGTIPRPRAVPALVYIAGVVLILLGHVVLGGVAAALTLPFLFPVEDS